MLRFRTLIVTLFQLQYNNNNNNNSNNHKSSHFCPIRKTHQPKKTLTFPNPSTKKNINNSKLHGAKVSFIVFFFKEFSAIIYLRHMKP